MPVKIEKKCARCRRTESVTVESASDAVKVEELEKAREAAAKQVEAYLLEIDPKLMPDVVACVKGTTIVLTDLCDPGDDTKRSCLKRVQELVKAINTLDERKPRPSKKAAAE